MPGTTLDSPPRPGSADSDECAWVYSLWWRTRSNRPWQSEEFTARSPAHQRYFLLVGRGIEVYLERRSRMSLPA